MKRWFMGSCFLLILTACQATEETTTLSSPAIEQFQSDVKQKAIAIDVVHEHKAVIATDSVGPMTYIISDVSLQTVTMKNKETAALYGLPLNQPIPVLFLHVTGENTSADPVSFYLGQGKVTTSTHEVALPHPVLSNRIDGEYGPREIQTGMNAYVFLDTPLDALEKLTFEVSAPHHKEETFGEDVSIPLIDAITTPSVQQ